MAINPYSTYAAYLSNVGGFQRLQTSLQTLTEQLNSGKKATDLTLYGSESQRLVDLRAEIARRQGYMETITAAQVDVKAYDQVYTNMEKLNADMMQAFTSPMIEPPTKQQDTIRFDGDIGDVGDIYKVVVDGVLFSYVTTGVEGSFDEIAGNLAAQINAYQPAIRATAEAVNDRLVITATEAGPLYNATVSKVDVAGGNDNVITLEHNRAGKLSSIIQQVDTAMVQLRALLNEQVNDRYLFGGMTANALAPVVDLDRLPNPIAPANSASSVTTQQLAAGTIVQEVRVTTDYLGTGQSETIDVDGNAFVFNGPMTQQELADAMAAAIGGVATVAVSDIDAEGFTIRGITPGTPFTISITGNDPTPSTFETVQANVPIGADQVDVITLDGPVGLIGEIFSVTITDPPTHTTPVTISYRTDGTEPDLDTIVDRLVARITDYVPAFTVTATNLGNGQLELRSATAFTSHATVQNVPTVETTQRTVVPVAQQDEVSFAGPYDAGDTYEITFTAPVAGPFTVVTAANDTESTIAAKFVTAINQAAIGVTAAVRNGKLSLTSDTPGTPFTYTTALTVDAGAVTTAPTSQTIVQNIPPGPLPQIDEIQLSGPVGRIGDVYEVTVNGHTVRYTTTGNEDDMDDIVVALAAAINADPNHPASALPGPVGSGRLVITADTPGVAMETEIQVVKPTSVGAPTPTDYSVYQAPTDSALAWQRGEIVIADQLRVRYRFSANEIAFQKLTLALRYAKAAIEDPDNYFSIMETARSLARESLTGIRSLHTDNTVNDALFSATTLSHQTAINANLDGTDKIEAIDPNEVAAKLQAVQVQLQATFSTVAATNRLSLVNFLA